jgi:hypothetical protein
MHGQSFLVGLLELFFRLLRVGPSIDRHQLLGRGATLGGSRRAGLPESGERLDE